MAHQSASICSSPWKANLRQNFCIALISGTALVLVAILVLGIYNDVEGAHGLTKHKGLNDDSVPSSVTRCIEYFTRMACHDHHSFNKTYPVKDLSGKAACARNVYAICTASPILPQSDDNKRASQFQQCVHEGVDACHENHPLTRWPNISVCASDTVLACYDAWSHNQGPKHFVHRPVNYSVARTGATIKHTFQKSIESEKTRLLRGCRLTKQMYCDKRFSPNITIRQSDHCAADADAQCEAALGSGSVPAVERNASTLVKKDVNIVHNGIMVEHCIRHMTQKCHSAGEKTLSGLIEKKNCFFREINVCVSSLKSLFVVIDQTGVDSHGAAHNGTYSTAHKHSDSKDSAGENKAQNGTSVDIPNSGKPSHGAAHNSTHDIIHEQSDSKNSTRGNNSSNNGGNAHDAVDHGNSILVNGTNATQPSPANQPHVVGQVFHLTVWLSTDAIVGELRPQRLTHEAQFQIIVNA